MQTFSQFAEAHGILIGNYYDSDRIHRCPTASNPRSKNGAYFWDGKRGWVQAWDGDGLVHWYGGEFTPWTDEEKREWGRRQSQSRQQRAQKQRQAAERTQQLINRCSQQPHGYLQLKGFDDIKALVTEDETLVIPMRDVFTGELLGGQLVRWIPEESRWEKKMTPGMRAKGAVLRLGPKQVTETVLCEGYATGLSIMTALETMRLNAAVLICFSDSNMRHVAESVSGMKYAYADNDASGAGERAAQMAGVPYCMSDILGNDANDDHVNLGVFRVARKLMTVRQEALKNGK